MPLASNVPAVANQAPPAQVDLQLRRLESEIVLQRPTSALAEGRPIQSQAQLFPRQMLLRRLAVQLIQGEALARIPVCAAAQVALALFFFGCRDSGF